MPRSPKAKPDANDSKGNLGIEHADTICHDLHPDLRADVHQFGFSLKGDANFAWVQHFSSN